MPKKLWNKDFVLMLQGGAVSAIGDILYSVAIGYWVYETTGSSALMGIMSSISLFVSMILVPFTGSIVDKCDRKAVIVGMDALRGLLMLGVGGLAFAGKLTVPVVLAAAFLGATCSVFFNPAVSTLLIDLIPHDEMVRGQSVHSGVNFAINLVGKGVSGALVVFFGVPLMILLNGVSYLLSALTEAFITVPRTKRQGERVTLRGVFRDFGGAFQSIAENPALRVFVLGALATNLLGAGPMYLLLPFVLEKGFTVESYGLLMSVQTAASLLGVFLLGTFKFGAKTRYRLMAGGFLIGNVLFLAAFLSRSEMSLYGFMFLASAANAVGNGVVGASFMLALPEDNRGAVLGLFQSGCTGGCALSSVIFGFLCDRFPIYLVFVAGQLLSAIPMAVLCLNRHTRTFIQAH